MRKLGGKRVSSLVRQGKNSPARVGGKGDFCLDGVSTSPTSPTRKLQLLVATMLGLVVLVGSPPAVSASPITYNVMGGSVSILVFVGATLVGQTSSSGLGGSVTLDPVAHTMDALNLILDPNIALSLSAPYGGYDEITIETSSLTSDVGFGALGSPSLGSSSYTVLVGPLTVNGSWGATDSSGTNPPQSGIPISYPVPSLTAVIDSFPLLSIVGVTLNSLDGTSYGEASDLTVLASFTVNSLVVIPEPGPAMLLGLGLVVLAASRRRGRAL